MSGPTAPGPAGSAPAAARGPAGASDAAFEPLERDEPQVAPPAPPEIAAKVVPEGTSDGRLDKVVAELFGISRRRAMEWVAEDRVRVNGRRVPKGQPVAAGSRVEVRLPPPDAPVPQPDLPLRIVHADAFLVVADKPAGMPSHPLKPGELGTAANALVGRFAELAKVGPSAREGGLVHRLDTDTSGLLLAARTDAAHALLRAQFAARTVQKGYLALAFGEIHGGGEVALPLAHDPQDPRKVRAASDPEWAAEHGARPAITRFSPIERRGGFTLLEVEIPTGVLHQIRAHLAFIGHPIAGDALYGGQELPGLHRHFLHAARLELAHPDGSTARFQSSLPPDLAAVLAGL